MTWLYVHCPDLYFETLLANENSQKALALSHPGSSQLSACNPLALQAGTHVGMAVSTAYCLCPSLSIQVFDRKRAEQTQQKFTELLSAFSGHISLDDDFGFYLEIGSMTRLFGSAERLHARLNERLSQAAHRTRSAIAPNPKAARLLARYATSPCVADGATLAQHLDPLPLKSLMPQNQALSRLHKSGFRVLGDLRKIPEQDLAYRMGLEATQELKRLYGELHWQPAPFKSMPRFQKRIEFMHEIESAKRLLLPMSRLLKAFCQYLQARHYTASRAVFQLSQRDQQPNTLLLALASSENAVDTWLFQLEHALSRLSLQAPVTGLSFQSLEIQPREVVHQSLFSKTRSSGMSQAALSNRLCSRMGLQSTQFLKTQADHRPEYQTRSDNNPTGSSPLLLFTDNSPTWLLTTPRPIQPSNYQLQQGPLRLSSGWLDQHPINRDYYIAREQHSQALHWLFCDAQKHWYCHGFYA